jgi:hypothetical protein
MSNLLIPRLPFQQRVEAIKAEILRVPSSRNLSEAEIHKQALKEAQSYENRPSQPRSYSPSTQMSSQQSMMFMSLLSQMMQAMSQLGGGFSSFLGSPQPRNYYGPQTNHQVGYGPNIGQGTGYGPSVNYNHQPSYQQAYTPAPAPAYTPAPAPAPQPPAKKGGYA